MYWTMKAAAYQRHYLAWCMSGCNPVTWYTVHLPMLHAVYPY